jgi:tetrahydromethanopterin S-methyltransferase subunit C
MLVAKLAGQTIESMSTALQPASSGSGAGSLAILGFSFAVTLAGLFQGKTTMWDGVPEWAAAIVFFILVSVVGAP